MRVGSLCSGIGGLDLGLEWAGMTVIWQAETDPFASAVLRRHWPDVPNLGDVTTIDWSAVERPDLICAGYPCQPFSLAGRRAGETDDRHVWPAIACAVRDLRPRRVLLENVPGHLSLGFGRVLGDLAALGYDAEWTCLSAAATGAPHLRIRLFVVAYPSGDPVWDEPAGLARRLRAALAGHDGPDRPLADADPSGRDGRAGDRRARRRAQPADGGEQVADADSERAAVPGGERGEVPGHGPELRPQRRRGGLADPDGPRQLQPGRGLPELGRRPLDGGQPGREWWSVEPDVGRVADGVPSRLDRLRTLGNAVVPQCAELIGRALLSAEEEQ